MAGLPGMRALAIAAFVTIAVVGGIFPPTAALAGSYPRLFGTGEIASRQLSLFPKWKGMLARYFDERRVPEAPCESTFFNRCQLREWSAFVESLRGRDRMTQLRDINAYLNRTRYIIDPRNYGVPDYWATPHQFLIRDGDCEDYAITKYMSLRALGFEPAQMRIVVLQDLNLRTAHAILVVYLDGQALVLDNQIHAVVNARTIRHYRPIYSINEQYWWLHRS
jgi:predicted transglutaminase-like cysteine proteinase